VSCSSCRSLPTDGAQAALAWEATACSRRGGSAWVLAARDGTAIDTDAVGERNRPGGRADGRTPVVFGVSLPGLPVSMLMSPRSIRNNNTARGARHTTNQRALR
jgi:hypothetical protein